MQQSTTIDNSLPSDSSRRETDSSRREVDSSGPEPRDVLTGILRRGAQQMLAAAIDNEVAEYIAAHACKRDAAGHRLVVRNGHMPARSIQTGLGPVEVARPRVNDKRRDADGNRMLFTSRILPPYLRRTKGSGSRAAYLAMVFKLAQAAEKRWRQLNGSALLPDVIRGVRFVDSIRPSPRKSDHPSSTTCDNISFEKGMTQKL